MAACPALLRLFHACNEACRRFFQRAQMSQNDGRLSKARCDVAEKQALRRARCFAWRSAVIWQPHTMPRGVDESCARMPVFHRRLSHGVGAGVVIEAVEQSSVPGDNALHAARVIMRDR